MGKVINMIGKKYGLVTVIGDADPYISPSGKSKERRVWGQCDCGSPPFKVVARQLRNGDTQSCGCLRKETTKLLGKSNKKYNKYDLESKDYGIGWISDDYKFLFDKEDYDLIKNYCWRLDSKGRVISYDGEKIIQLHRLIMGITNKDIQIDHKMHNPLDNRKKYLRIANNSKNKMNNGLRKDNTTGCTGVSFNKNIGKYYARITINNKTIYLGGFVNKEDAIKERKKAEEKYFGKWSYDNSMKVD